MLPQYLVQLQGHSSQGQRAVAHFAGMERPGNPDIIVTPPYQIDPCSRYIYFNLFQCDCTMYIHNEEYNVDDLPYFQGTRSSGTKLMLSDMHVFCTCTKKI